MDDPKSRFIEAATRPFADQAETRLAAKAWLEIRVQGDELQLEVAVRRWENGNPRRSGWWFAYFGLIALVSAGVLITMAGDTFAHAKWMVASLRFSSGPPNTKARVFRNLSESDKLLFPADESGGALAPGSEFLWRSGPENPAYFAEYARAFSKENGQLPPDYFETTRRIDPDNAFFTYLAAELEAKEAVGQNPDQSWTIKDPARMDRVLAFLREARNQEGYKTYGAEMLGRRLSVLGQGNLPESMDAVTMLAYNQRSNFFIHLQATICARSWTAAETGNTLAFQEIVIDGESFLRRICGNQVETLLNEIVLVGTASAIGKRFAEDAEKLGLMEVSERWSGISARLAENRKDRSTREFLLDGRPTEPREYASLLIESSLEVGPKVSRSQVPLTLADLKPGRLLDHMTFSRILSIATWILMALALAATALYRFRVSAMHRGLARQAVALLDVRDWAWIAGAGVLGPFGYVMAVNHLTPLGGHDYGLRATALMLPAVHFLGLWLLWLTVPPQMVRWRLAKRAGLMGLPKASWLGWGMTTIAFAFIPLAGWAAVSRSFGIWENWISGRGIETVAAAVSPTRFRLAAGLVFSLTAWIVVRALGSLLRTRGLMSATATSLALITVFAGTLLVAALAIPVFKASGQYWFDRDRMIKADPSMPGWTAYEARIAVQARKELREALGDGFQY